MTQFFLKIIIRTMEKLFRLNPILEILKSSPGRVNKILIQKEKTGGKTREIIEQAREANIPFLFVPRQKLFHLAPDHQGVVAFISSKEFSSLEDILASTKVPFLVLLDQIEDPQNLGAIIRSAEGAGADGIVLPERRSAGLTQAVYSVSAGAVEHLNVARVTNLAQTMDILKKRGIWLVGAEGGTKEYWYEFDYRLPVGLVFGSEGKGLRSLIKKKCDKILSIPLFGRISSLNVASAASIFLFEVARQRMNRKKE